MFTQRVDSGKGGGAELVMSDNKDWNHDSTKWQYNQGFKIFKMKSARKTFQHIEF